MPYTTSVDDARMFSLYAYPLHEARFLKCDESSSQFHLPVDDMPGFKLVWFLVALPILSKVKPQSGHLKVVISIAGNRRRNAKT